MAFLCRVLKVTRPGCYAQVAGEAASRARRREEEALVAEIRVLRAGSRGAYGAPRIHAALARAGRAANLKRGVRLMPRRGLTRQARRVVLGRRPDRPGLHRGPRRDAAGG
ncbi:IS3 family transposase [Streptomyces sp. NPDC055663]